jgi:hypothetical protein
MMIDMADNAQDSIARELAAWHTTGLRIAIWGSTAESAAFMETHGLDAHRFLVPGTGQPIRDWLLENPVDIILIPCQFRAADIVREIDAARITYEGILIPREGHLVDFHAAEMMLA